MGKTGTSADQIPEAVVNAFGQLLHDTGFTSLPVSISMRTTRSPAFMLAGTVAELEAYAVLPSEYQGVPIERKLIERVTAAEAVEICQLLRRLRSAPVEPAADVKEDEDGGQCGRVD